MGWWALELSLLNFILWDERNLYHKIVFSFFLLSVCQLFLILCFCRMSVSMVFYGISLNTSNMNGNKYLNCFFSAFIDIIAYLAAWLFANRVTRPTLLFCAMMLSGVMLMVIQLIPEGVGSLFHLPSTKMMPSLHDNYFFSPLRHAYHDASVYPGWKDWHRCCVLLHLCIFHWALSHCGEEYGLWGGLNSCTHGQHHMSIHHLYRQVFRYCVLFGWLKELLSMLPFGM